MRRTLLSLLTCMAIGIGTIPVRIIAQSASSPASEAQESSAVASEENNIKSEERVEPANEAPAPTDEAPPEEKIEEGEEMVEEEPPTFDDFYDLDADEWYAPYVQAIVAWKIASGYRDGEGTLTGFFGPEDPVTVGQFLKMALNAAQYDVSSCDESLVPPEAAGHWSEQFVACAKEMNMRIFKYRVNLDRPILRGEAVALLDDAFEVQVPPLPSAFTDTTNHPYRSDIAYAAARYIVTGPTWDNGKPKGIFLPNDNLNRAEAAKILYLMIHADNRSRTDVRPVVLDIYVSNYTFSPSTLFIRHGQSTTFRFHTTGRHTFIVDGLGISYQLTQPMQATTFTPKEEGTFKMYCDLPGHSDAGMIGQLIVQ